MNNGGIANVDSSSESIINSQSSKQILSPTFGQIGFYIRWIIIIVGFILIAYGIFRLMNGTKNNNQDIFSEGYKFIKLGVTIYLCYISFLSCFIIIGKYGMKKALFTIILTGGIAILMTTIPSQFFSGIVRQLFYEWFEDSDIERIALKSFNSLHIMPWIAIIVVITLSFIILLI